MTIHLSRSVKNILILGAGASVDYGLPVWKDLGNLILKEVNEGLKENYKHKTEILQWLEKVGENSLYKTIDECIRSESILPEYTKSTDIENELFSAIKNLFEKMYKKNDNGWIKVLNGKILNNENLEQSLAFVNFNYDDVLEKNFLNFSNLPSKYQEYNYRERLLKLSLISAIALYPHGKFAEAQVVDSHIAIHKDTMKSHQNEHLDVVSCYESKKHTVYGDLSNHSFELYLLGLGGGLEVNLNNIEFPYNKISTVHVTIKDPKKKEEVIKFLSEKYKTSDIKPYSTCEDLIQKCFDD